MKQGLILVNAYWKSEAEINQSRRLKEEFARMGVSVDVRRNDFFPVHVNGDGALEKRLDPYDFCVYLDKDKYVSRMLEKTGLRLFNRSQAIADCDDKMLTYIALSDCGISVPKTLPGLLCYTPTAVVAPGTLDYIEKEIGYPVIVKESYGSLGKGVFKADDRAQLEAYAERLKFTPHLYQRFVAKSEGRDVRVIVVGGEIVACMKRVSRGDFRSNAALGGKGEKFDLPDEGARLCKKISAVLGLDYCGIDLLFGEEGFLVCEVNSNAFFGTIEKVTGVNVAHAYARYIFRQIYGGQS